LVTPELPKNTTTSSATSSSSSTSTTSTSTTPIPRTPTTPPSPSTTTTVKPPPNCRHFDGPSFIGGIVLTIGLLAISFVAYKFYKTPKTTSNGKWITSKNKSRRSICSKCRSLNSSMLCTRCHIIEKLKHIIIPINKPSLHSVLRDTRRTITIRLLGYRNKKTPRRNTYQM
ncbi:uncharacterized protein LOC119658183, partial [Hermetia illucens]|uniref:uncharacterized protein LOC119658183 n=1 Tax=Hermetia illucens TaxID=343691 RepID=UPI0018CC5EDC